MLRSLSVAASLLILLPVVGCFQPSSRQDPTRSEVVLLATTSFQDTGLADVLIKDFTERTGYPVKVIAVGTGSALKQGAQGEGDVVLVHDPEQEQRWMAEGNGTSRRLVMYNDFVLVGPPGDLATIKGLSPVVAFQRLAEQQAPFVSRGDRSGTHTCERSLWQKAGIDPTGKRWYTESGQGQGLTLDIASQQQRYALTDRGTFLAHQKRLDLAILVENDPALVNLYHVMTVNAEKFPKVNVEGGKAFADYLVSEAAQQLIAEFGKAKFGRPLFIPAAGKSDDDFRH
jgi:tungstate transport system substrate-binding protein